MPTETGLHQRMKEIVGQRTYRAVGHLTNTNPETVRRYLQGQAPSVEFLGALCKAMEVNAHWLLTGKGPMLQSHARQHALTEANPSELLAAVAEALEQLIERVDRLESYVQTLETRLRSGMAGQSGGPVVTRPLAPGPARAATLQQSEARDGNAGATPRARAARIGDAVPERPPSDAD